MSQRVLDQVVNIGILAHVDAGKTSLTERLLYEHGAIPHLGSVDGGNSTTDSGELERERGITIRSAVATFTTGNLRVNLVDTPGHPDFVAEVERALGVLDGAVLVLSAVEGVQAQTRVIMRSLRRMALPTLLFVNKVDRAGARYDDLLDEIRSRLGVPVAPLTTLDGDARPLNRAEITELLAERDEHLLARFVDDDLPNEAELRTSLRAELVHPVYFGSAVTGAGVAALVEGIAAFLPPPPADASAEPDGTVFAIERTGGREKVAYLRLFAGTVRSRQSVVIDGRRVKVSRVEVVGGGPLTAGNIAKLHGLPEVRVGDRLGTGTATRPVPRFAPPVLAAVVRSTDLGGLHAALTALADEDPLIRTRTTPDGATSVLLYGAVQREVIAERLRREFGVEARFDEVEPEYVERPSGVGAAVIAFVPHQANAYWQTVGLRVEPGGPGNSFVVGTQAGLIPNGYYRAIEASALAALRQGLHGWEVTDCRVTLTEIDCVAPLSSAAAFRGLTAIVLGRALADAGTTVFEPTYAIEADVPRESLAAVVGYLATAEAEVTATVESDAGWVVSGLIPVRRLTSVGAALPGLTGGRGSLLYSPGPDRRLPTAKMRRKGKNVPIRDGG